MVTRNGFYDDYKNKWDSSDTQSLDMASIITYKSNWTVCFYNIAGLSIYIQIQYIHIYTYIKACTYPMACFFQCNIQYIIQS